MTLPSSRDPDSPTASQRLSMAMGLPPPAPLSEQELREFELAEDRADEEAARFYGRRRRDAA